MRRLGPAVLLALLAAILISPVAEAKKKPKPPAVSVRTATASTTAADQVASATATCPVRTIALGGGFALPFVQTPSSVSDIVLLYESRRSGPRSWTASGGRLDSGSPGPALELTAYVTCRAPLLAAKTKPKKKAETAKQKKRRLTLTEVSSTSASVGENGQVATSASCTGGRRALSGGFSSAPLPMTAAGDAFPVINSSLRTAPGIWTASMTNVGEAPRSLTAYVYCASGATSSELAGASPLPETPSFANLGKATGASPACPKRRRVVAGGFNGPFSFIGARPFITGSVPQGAAWSTSAINLSPTAGAVTSIGYCL